MHVCLSPSFCSDLQQASVPLPLQPRVQGCSSSYPPLIRAQSLPLVPFGAERCSRFVLARSIRAAPVGLKASETGPENSEDDETSEFLLAGVDGAGGIGRGKVGKEDP